VGLRGSTKGSGYIIRVVQTQQVLANIDAVLAQLGGTKADIASVQVWLADMADYVGMNAVWDAWVDRDNPPARATGGVALARKGMRVEMIVVARSMESPNRSIR